MGSIAMFTTAYTKTASLFSYWRPSLLMVTTADLQRGVIFQSGEARCGPRAYRHHTFRNTQGYCAAPTAPQSTYSVHASLKSVR